MTISTSFDPKYYYEIAEFNYVKIGNIWHNFSWLIVITVAKCKPRKKQIYSPDQEQKPKNLDSPLFYHIFHPSLHSVSPPLFISQTTQF